MRRFYYNLYSFFHPALRDEIGLLRAMNRDLQKRNLDLVKSLQLLEEGLAVRKQKNAPLWPLPSYPLGMRRIVDPRKLALVKKARSE